MTRSGFTLLELLVAAVLAAIIAGAAATLLDTAGRARQQLESRAERRAIVEGVLDFLTDDLAGALATGTAQDPGFLGNDDGSGDLALDTLQFLTLSGKPERSTSEPESDFRVLRYYVETDPDQDDQGLVREETSLLTGTSLFGEDIFRRDSLAEEVAEFDVEFFDGVAWQIEWDSNVNEGLPKAVRIAIALTDDEARAVKIVPLRISREFESQAAEEGQ